MSVPRLEKEIGIECYATHSHGVEGILRRSPEDFVVEEILADGSKAQVSPAAASKISGRGRYLVCALVKRNLDTFLAVQAIAEGLGIDRERVHIAGIKDKRALTAQHISIGRFLPEQVAQLKRNNLWLYPLRFSNEKITTSLLFGNQFNIVVRGIAHPPSEITKRMKKVHNELQKFGGCPNFYGHQRFGTTRSITHRVGKQILLANWEEAAHTFLSKPSPDERPDSRRAREQLWSNQNYSEALRNFPPRLAYERKMLEHLARRPKDYVGAFYRLPRKLCYLFVQAYQSYLFNKFLSERIRNRLSLGKACGGEYTLKTDNKEHVALPLIGYKQHVSKGQQGDFEKNILEKEMASSLNFKVSAMPEISCAGGLRTALTPLIGFICEKPLRDSFASEGMMRRLGFTLRKGSYATILLREFMKPRDPIMAGF